jgi:hypothetical protein
MNPSLGTADRKTDAGMASSKFSMEEV